MLKHHAIFQGYNFFQHLGMDRDMRDRFKDSPNYTRTEEFVALYDNPAFDPAAKALPLAEFEPMLAQVCHLALRVPMESWTWSDKAACMALLLCSAA